MQAPGPWREIADSELNNYFTQSMKCMFRNVCPGFIMLNLIYNTLAAAFPSILWLSQKLKL